MFPASFPHRLSRTGLKVGALFLIGILPLTAYALGGRDDQPAIITGIGRVVDGDTLDVGPTRVRLEGIDAPEIAQTCQTARGETWNCGVAAATMLRKLAEHQDLSCDRKGTDRYRRVLATCFADGIDIDEAMVKAGLAWAFVRYSVTYVGVETEARNAKIGVWQGPAEAPWDFRRNEWQVAETGAPKGCAIKGNVSSHGRIYHMPWDPWYDSVNMDLAKGKRWFCSEQDAIAAGWRPASPN
ncbi:thermonuclease family protein [Hyphomicrobium sp.]|jgi:endonuclease YncB( thermonuclease family)|uniref:thermonuclease family protein n=1 Tax=Hyphomicrobium sp. TaxID=82 RepID=UPI0035677163